MIESPVTNETHPLKHILAVCFLICMSTQIVVAQGAVPTKGREFWLGFLQNSPYSAMQPEELSVFITSDQTTTGTIEIPAQGWSQNFNITANETTTLTIPNALAEHFTSEVIENKGVFIATEDTVAVFAINFESFSADATRILPIQTLGSEYRVAAYSGAFTGTEFGSELLIVATEDDTEIEIIPTVNTLGGQPAGAPFTVQLDRGQSYQVKSANEGLDLTGTLVRATENSGGCRPFAVFSGSVCANVPENCTSCDHIFEQNLPVPFWGTEYISVPFAFTGQYTLRLLANEANTSVSLNGGAPSILAAGEYLEINGITGTRCITASAPIAVVQYMEGVSCAGNGDPAMLLLSANDQRIDRITFSTVTSDVITDHGISVIIPASDIGSFTVDGQVVNPSQFQAVPACSGFAYAHVTVAEGSHELFAPNGFTAYVYGVGPAESYTYSAGSYTPPVPFEVTETLCTNDEVVLEIDPALSEPYWYAQSNPDEILANTHTLVLEPPYTSDIYVGVGQLLASGCETEAYFSVESPDPIEVTINAPSSMCTFQTVDVEAVTASEGNYAFQWSPSHAVNDPTSGSTTSSISETTTLIVTVSTPSGCGSGSATHTITVNSGNVTDFNLSTEETLLCHGESTLLSLDLSTLIFEDNFDPGVSWGLWSSITGGAASQNCGSVSGNALYFNGAGQRQATTNPVNVENGGSLYFHLKMGSDVAPCDQVNPGEEIVLEYSTSGLGGPYTLIDTYFPADFVDFTLVTVPIPAAAVSPNTQFRWRQLMHSGINQDNWALDDVAIGAVNAIAPTITWNPMTGIASPDATETEVTPEESGWYSISFTDTGNGCTYSDSVFIEVVPPLNLQLNSDTTICVGESVQLQAAVDYQGSASFTWQGPNLDNPGSASAVATPTASTTYTVLVESSVGCTAEGSLEVNVNALSNLTLSGGGALCNGEPGFIEAQFDGNPDDLLWGWSPTGGLTSPDEQATEAHPETSTWYVFTVGDPTGGCLLTDSVHVQVGVPFSIDPGDDLVLCEVAGYELNVTHDSPEPLTWSWTNEAVLSDAGVPNPELLQDGNFSFEITATDPVGCVASASLEVVWLTEGFGLGVDVEECEGTPVELSSGLGDGAAHTWNTGENTPVITVSSSDVYTVTVVTVDGCEVSDEVEVTYFAYPELTFNDVPTLCEGETYEIAPQTDGETFEWSTGAITQNIEVAADGTYILTAFNSIGCATSDEVDVLFNPLPVIELPDEVVLCDSETAVLDAGSDGVLYTWSTGASSQIIAVTQEGEYSVEVISGVGCSNTATTEVFVSSFPVVELGPDTALCEGQWYLLDAGLDGWQYSWSSGQSSQTIQVNETGFYSVEVSNGYCVTEAAVSVLFLPVPEAPEFGVDRYCPEEAIATLLLNAENEGADYLWNTGSTAQELELTAGGSYWVTITNEFGCAETFYHEVAARCDGYTLYIPNAFTPDNDGVNDIFQASGTNIVDFEMTIWNRWGEVVWVGESLDDYWDGSYPGGTHYVQADAYVYTVRYRYLTEDDRVSQWRDQRGSVVVIR